MYIICAKCGMHFNSIEAAREHSGQCRETSTDVPIRWIPSRETRITPKEWKQLMSLISDKDSSHIPPPNTTKIRKYLQEKEVTKSPTFKDTRVSVKQTYPRHMQILAKFILFLIAVFAIVLLGGGVYIVAQYYANAWDWTSQLYQTLTGNVITLTDAIKELWGNVIWE